jgi:hypothetical protein
MIHLNAARPWLCPRELFLVPGLDVSFTAPDGVMNVSAETVDISLHGAPHAAGVVRNYASDRASM